MNFLNIKKIKSFNSDIQHYLFFLACQAGRMPLLSISTAILARLLGPEGLGRWAMITASANLIHVLFINWFQQSPLLRFGKEEWVTSGTIERSWNARLPMIGVGFVLSILLFTVVPGAWLGPFFHLSLKEGLLSLAFFFSLIISTEIQVILQILGRMFRLAFVPVLITGITALVYLVIWFGFKRANPLPLVLIGVVLTTIGIWIGSSFDLLNLAKINFSQWDQPLFQDMIHFAWPLFPSAILGYLLDWGNQLVIQHFFPTREVGLYQTAFQVHSLITSAAVPITTIIVPKLIERQLGDPTSARRFLNSVAPTINSLWIIMVIPMVVVLPSLFILIFGKKFYESVPALNLILCCTPLISIGQVYTVLYTVEKRMKDIFLISVVMVLINFACIFTFLRVGGIYGAAASFCVAFTITRFLYYFIQHRLFDQPIEKMNILFGTSILFSVGQLGLKPLGLRMVWGIIIILSLIWIIRKSKIADPALIKRLFSGPLEFMGQIFLMVLVKPQQLQA